MLNCWFKVEYDEFGVGESECEGGGVWENWRGEGEVEVRETRVELLMHGLDRFKRIRFRLNMTMGLYQSGNWGL